MFGEGHTIAHYQAGAKLPRAFPHTSFGNPEALGYFVRLVNGRQTHVVNLSYPVSFSKSSADALRAPTTPVAPRRLTDLNEINGVAVSTF